MRIRAAVVLAVLVVTGCTSSGASGYVETTYPVRAAAHVNHPAPIGHGRMGTAAWTLLADVEPDGKLCLGVHWRPGEPGEQYGCGFGDGNQDDEGRGVHPVDTQGSAAGETVAYGPAPAGASRVTLTPDPGTCPNQRFIAPLTAAITHELPDWYGGRGGWFVQPLSVLQADCYFDAVFRDAAGRVVPQPRNF